ncbi:MAG: sigma-70 family RNA polymerase sigma factor [Tannerellaceae bacterium]|jgi:RNA polymerase sigma factor (sigma-70 family)|nr:sigma-70 family RNA polymerase sigma factor [Tannerellaceae bacterium]
MIRGLHSQEDTVFWEKFVSGDDEAYAYFYQKYVKVLFSYGMRFTSDRELVKDCIHDVFVELYSKRPNLRHVNQIQAYLFISLKNELYTIFQKDKIVYYIDMQEPVFCIDYTTEEHLIAEEQEIEEQKKLRRILDSLTPRQKEVIYYRYIQGMELDEICKLMEINYQSLQNLIQRSIKKIKKTFDETGNTIQHVKKHMSIIKQK